MVKAKFLTQTSAPATPSAGRTFVYTMNESGILFHKDTAGNVKQVGVTFAQDINSVAGTVSTGAFAGVGNIVVGTTGRYLGNPTTYFKCFGPTGQILYIPAYQGV